MLLINKLEHCYGSTQVLKEINLNLPQRTLVGLLGHNGSGKSTLLKILGATYACQRGEIQLFGNNALDSSRFIRPALRQLIGILFQNTSSDPVLSVRQNLFYFAHLMGLPRQHHEIIIKETLHRANLVKQASMPVKNLSHGMRRRLEIYRCFMHKPKLLILDEPTEGLDFEETRKFWAFVKSYVDSDDALVILATHRAAELEHCQQIIMLHHGLVVAQSSVKELLAPLDYLHVEVSLNECSSSSPIFFSPLFIPSRERPHVRVAKITPSALYEVLASPTLTSSAVQSVRWMRPHLHDAYEIKTREHELC